VLLWGVGFYVDGCLGGFIFLFGEQFGFLILVFDFWVFGVMMIFVDIYKYGYGLKGILLLFFRDWVLCNS